MFNLPDFPILGKAALHKLFAVVFTSCLAGLIGFGAFAIGNAIGESTSIGIAAGSLAFLSLFPLIFSMLTLPEEGVRATGDQALTLQKVFSGLL